MKFKVLSLAFILFTATTTFAVQVETEAALKQAATDANTESAEVAKDITVTSQITINKAFTVTGAEREDDPSGNPQRFAVSGDGAAGIFKVTTDKGFNISNIILKEGDTTASGGALNIEFANAATASENSIENVSFRENNAAVDGGAVNIKITGTPAEHSAFSIKESSFTENTAVANGGAINIDSTQDITIDESSFTKNEAAQGGALNAAGTGKLTLTNLTFDENLSSANGGAVFTASDITADKLTFEKNEATDDGGALYIDGSEFTATNLTFTENKGANGGALYNNTAADTKITTAQFTKNTAGADGGAIYNLGDIELSKVAFTENTAAAGGGAVYTNGGFKISGAADFTKNSAGTDGGAVYLESGATAEISGTVNFTENTAVNRGGAIYLGASSEMTLAGNISFTGNTAAAAASNALYMEAGSKLNLTSGTITFNDDIMAADNTAEININTARLNLNNDMAGFIGTLNAGNGTLGIKNDLDLSNATLDASTAIIDMRGGIINNLNLGSAATLTANTKVRMDIDLSNDTADTITGTGTVTVADFNILKDAPGAASGIISLGSGINFVTDTNRVYFGPVFGYYLTQNTSTDVSFTSSGNFNPLVLAQPVAANSAVLNNMLVVESLLNRMPLTTDKKKLDMHKTWFVPYAAGQKFDFKQGIEGVKNQSYGGSAGVDFPAADMGIMHFVPSVFAGYNGAKQQYKDTLGEVKTSRDSALAGVMGVFFNDYILTAAEAHVSNGTVSSDFQGERGSFDIFAFTAAAKAEIDIPLGSYTLQPAFLASYNLVNAQSYTTSTGGHVESSKLNNVKTAPQIRLMKQIKTWRPYITAAYYFNAFNDFDAAVNTIALPEAEPKNYMQYGIGLENTFIETYSFFVNVSGYAGGVQGVAAQAGFRGYF